MTQYHNEADIGKYIYFTAQELSVKSVRYYVWTLLQRLLSLLVNEKFIAITCVLGLKE